MEYSEKVKQNMHRMGTEAREWKALPITGFAQVEDDKKKMVSMPVFDFSLIKGFTKPDTAYPCGNIDANCELCGHDIKKVYHIYNPSRKFSLMVGSECVTHFNEGVSGKDQIRLDRIEMAKLLDSQVSARYDDLRSRMAYQEKPSRDWRNGRTIYCQFNVADWKGVSVPELEILKRLGVHRNSPVSGLKVLAGVAKCFVRYDRITENEGQAKAEAQLLTWYKRMEEGRKVADVMEALDILVRVLGW